MVKSHKNIIADITKQRDSIKEKRDMYQRWYAETSDKADKVKNQVKAIAVLINSIFPER